MKKRIVLNGFHQMMACSEEKQNLGKISALIVTMFCPTYLELKDLQRTLQDP